MKLTLQSPNIINIMDSIDALINKYERCDSYELMLWTVRNDYALMCQGTDSQAVAFLRIFLDYLEGDSAVYPAGIDNIGPGIDGTSLYAWMRSVKSRLNNG